MMPSSTGFAAPAMRRLATREDAIVDYRKALALDPDNGPAALGLTNLGAER